MKTSLLLSGVIPDNYIKYYDSIYKTIIEPFEPDIFISTWSSDKVNDVLSLYKPKISRIEDFEENSVKMRLNSFLSFLKKINYVGNKWVMLNSTYPMFYKIYDVNNLKIENEKIEGFVYDLVIRGRFDLDFSKKHYSFTIEPFLFNKIDENELMDLNHIYLKMDGFNHTAVNDTFAFGDSYNMNIYSEVFLNLKKIITSESIINEPILYKHLFNNNISLRHTKTTFDIKCYDK